MREWWWWFRALLMTGNIRCQRRKKMMGRGADGGCGTEEKPCPVSRVPAVTKTPVGQSSEVEESVSFGADFFSQARKALAERSPFDSDEALASTVPTLPTGLASLLLKHADSRKRHKKSHSDAKSSKKGSLVERGKSYSLWAESEEYFRELTLLDIDKLYELSTSLDSLVTNSGFRIPVSGNALWNSEVGDRNRDNAESKVKEEANANANGTCFGSESVVVEQVPNEENGKSMDVDVDACSSDTMLQNRQSSSLKPLVSFSSVEWVLGSRNKFLLTTERPTKKRKLLGENAGLQRLIVARPCDGKSNLCHFCSVGDTGDQLNQLVVCRACNVAVHQKCYGVQGDVDQSWLCFWCTWNGGTDAARFSGSERPCVLCPKPGGALKPVRRAGGGSGESVQFAHLFCTQWMPEVYVDDMRMMEPVVNVEEIKETRWKLVCNVCKVRHGACIRCTDGACRTSFHPMCARESGNRLEIWGKLGCDDVELKAFCSKHSEVTNGVSALHHVEENSASGDNSSSPRHPPSSLPGNKLHEFKTGHKNVNSIAMHDEALNANSDKLDDAEAKTKDKQEVDDVGQFTDVHTILMSTAEDLGTPESINLAPVLRKIIDRGKVTLKEMASDTGICADSLAAALAGQSMDPELNCKVTDWLTRRAYMGAPQKNLIVKIKSSLSSKAEMELGNVSDAVALKASDTMDVPVKSVPPRRRMVSNIRIMKDDRIVFTPKDKCGGNGISTNCINVQQLEDEACNDSRKVLISNSMEKSLVKPVGFGDSMAEPSPPSETEDSMPSGTCAPLALDQVIPTCPSNTVSHYSINTVSMSGSYVNPYIHKKIGETQSLGVKKMLSDSDGAKELNVSPKEQFSDGGACSNHQDHPACALAVDRCKKANEMGVFDSCPEDEVEGEIIYCQHWLLTNAIARKNISGDLVSKIVKNLPQEMEAIRKRRWDDVLVNQYLYELREARKQGRKERRHREAQAVLAAATAAAAASSRVSSLRKDVDESSHQENQLKMDTSRGRGGPYSQLIPRVKETTSSLATPRVASEKHSDLLQFTSAFSKEHPRSCDICGRLETILNPILVCSGCKVAVHLDCYRGVKEYTGPWYCELCEELSLSKCSGASVVNSWEKSYPIVECALCGTSNGAFRKCHNGQWIHAFCAEWVFESTFRRGQVNPVEGMETITKGVDVCAICHQRFGVCIKCSYGHCQITFHPSCGRCAGYYMIARNVGGKLQHKAYCDKHSVEQRAKAETQRHGIEELKNLKQVRVELEKLRLICERIVKREKLKRELILCSHDILASKRDSVALSMLVHSPFFPPEVSSESATTSLRGHASESRSCSEAMQKSDDITVDSALSVRRHIKLPVSVDTDRKTDDSSTSQLLPTPKPMDRVSFAGKKIPYRASLAYHNISDSGEKRLKSRKHTETFEKELIMTSDQASMKNQRLPKGYIYVPIDCLPNEKQKGSDSFGRGDRDG
ncbi:hypothetical protein Ancab_038244 [Ancistrocladus abbreviatus]